MTITDKRLRELADSGCLCISCEPDLLDEVRPMAEELLAHRVRLREASGPAPIEPPTNPALLALIEHSTADDIGAALTTAGWDVAWWPDRAGHDPGDEDSRG